jgi:hypothetical protein
MSSKNDAGSRDPGDAKNNPETDRRASRSSADREGSKADDLRVESLKGNVYSTVGFDAKGNAILEWRTDIPGRRADDETLNYLKALDSDALHLAEDSGIAEPKSKSSGYNPYDKRK